ncbi:MAG: polysaccharide biosynthesis protein, partial [Rhizobacter sp.]|nr:polysaccharide biosynthesis protein [Rhizobacter sp.]
GLRPGEKLYEELLADNDTTLPTVHARLRIAQLQDGMPAALIEALEAGLPEVPVGAGDAVVKGWLKDVVSEYLAG